jgi:phenylpropionate dioxygenase-like ring-hydroxylating dioxygenase large terminal subunit
MAENFPHPLPSGWFAVRYADELEPGKVEPLHFFARDLVAFRGEDGRAHVLNAHCPHLGAHLGHGGEVVGNAIRCPFHAWEFDGSSGDCVAVPYAKRIPPRARVTCWPTCERNGLVLVWYHPEGKPPSWEVPEIPEATSPDWSEPERFEWTVRTQPQEITENAADSAHFRYVHGTLNVPQTEARFDGAIRNSLNKIRMKTPRGEVDGAVKSSAYGLGLVSVRYKGICETLQIGSVTPIDSERVVIRKAFSQQRVDGKSPEGGVAAGILRNVVGQLEQDIPIWENKVYYEKPLLCDGDGPIAPFRRWAQQFYADA